MATGAPQRRGDAGRRARAANADARAAADNCRDIGERRHEHAWYRHGAERAQHSDDDRAKEMAGCAGAPVTGKIVMLCRGKSKHRGHSEVLYARWADSASEIISGTAMEMIVTVFFVEHSDGKLTGWYWTDGPTAPKPEEDGSFAGTGPFKTEEDAIENAERAAQIREERLQ
jgi:hypothetical protein